MDIIIYYIHTKKPYSLKYEYRKIPKSQNAKNAKSRIRTHLKLNPKAKHKEQAHQVYFEENKRTTAPLHSKNQF